MKQAVAIATLLVAALSSIGCATRINPGHVGIEVEMAGSKRGVQDYTTTTGWVVYNPLATQVVEYPTFVQTYVWTKNNSEGDESFSFNTKDSMLMNLDVNLSYQLDPAKIPAFYVRFRNDDITNFTFGYLHNIARDCFTQVGSQYGVLDLMGNTGPFVIAVRECVQLQLHDIGVGILNFGIIGAPRPPQPVIQSINSKIQAQQIALQKQNEVQQAQADAQKRVAEAKGNAQAKIAEAEGEAAAKVAIAQGQATANKRLSESLTPALLEWRHYDITDKAVDKWDGARPLVEGSSSGLLLQIPVNERQKQQ